MQFKRAPFKRQLSFSLKGPEEEVVEGKIESERKDFPPLPVRVPLSSNRRFPVCLAFICTCFCSRLLMGLHLLSSANSPQRLKVRPGTYSNFHPMSYIFVLCSSFLGTCPPTWTLCPTLFFFLVLQLSCAIKNGLGLRFYRVLILVLTSW